MGPIENIFNPNWFASRNFHGYFYADSDILEEYLHFRSNIPVEEYFDYLTSQCDFYFRIPRLIPFKSALGMLVKPFMHSIAKTKVFGTLDWISTQNMDRITAFYGSIENYKAIPSDWSYFKIAKYNTSLAVADHFRLNHGLDETKPRASLNLEDMKEAAHFRGGECLSKSMTPGDLSSKLVWRCGHCGKIFFASPNLILFGGHWCPHCYVPHSKWDYDAIATTNPFFAQVWYPSHSHEERNTYNFDDLFTESVWQK